jgi:small subunit ribosomal protein S3
VGQKIHPNGFRVGITKDWDSRWYAKRGEFGKFLLEDNKVRKFIKDQYYFAAIPKIEIERRGEELIILVHTARPGVLIGRKGAKVDKLKGDLEGLTGRTVTLNVHEITRPELDAQLVAENVAEQLKKRSSFRRTMKKAMELTMDRGALGVRVRCSGRLGGAEIARTEDQSKGSIPLQTLTADIDYGFAEAHCTYGIIGIKCWIFKGPFGARKAGGGTTGRGTAGRAGAPPAGAPSGAPAGPARGAVAAAE